MRRSLFAGQVLTEMKINRSPPAAVYREWRGEKDVRVRGGTSRAGVIAAVIQRWPVFHRRQTGRSSLRWQLVAIGAGK